MSKKQSEIKKEYLDSLHEDDFYLCNLFDTIGNAFLDGVSASDQRWRDAIAAYFMRNNIPMKEFSKIYSEMREVRTSIKEIRPENFQNDPVNYRKHPNDHN